jgi:polysaccharide export outer membrane protein
MKYNSFYLNFTVLTLATFLLFSSCASKRDIVYFQNSDQVSQSAYRQNDDNYKIKIMPNDNLFIKVSAINPDAVQIFNVMQSQNGSMSTGNLDIMGYLVDPNGNINLPLVGEVHIAGLTKAEAIQLLQKAISKFVADPVVNIRILNYKISILGEVSRPGIYTVTDERISIPQAIALAGDLTIYGERHNVQLIRLENGEKKFYYFDLTSPDLFSSPNYYLLQNDILYVTPNGTKVRTSTSNQNIPLVISLISATLTVAAFLIANSKK